MASVFSLIDEHKCDGCARKIKKRVLLLKGVESAEVKKRQDENGNDDFTLVVKGSFNPEKIIRDVEKNTKKKIELVEPTKNNAEHLKKLNELASNNLAKAQKLKDLENENETLKAQLNTARARQNELAKQTRDILNRDLPNASLPQRSRSREPKKKDESEVLYGKLAIKEIKLEGFVMEYKKLQVKK